MFDRRRFALGGSAVGAAMALGACAAPARHDGATTAIDWNDPVFNVAAMARLTATMESGAQAHIHYLGKSFSVDPDGRTRPLYAVHGMGSLRAEPQPGGAVRFLFAEFAIACDLDSGEPLRRWRNPLTGDEVDVWHQRNGPVNYTLDPARAMFGNFRPVGGGNPAPGFRLPWRIEGNRASFAVDVVSDRPNPLLPARWPRESSGPRLLSSEHSQYFVDVGDLADPSRLSVLFNAALQSLKPWAPWMLMGQRPGRVYTTLTARKVSGLDALPLAVAALARSELAAFAVAPTQWTGQYLTGHDLYAREQQPRG